MPFRFAYVCELLSSLERDQTRDPPYLPARLEEEYRRIIGSWFLCHRARIDSSDTDCVALLSALFPERRTDRVYGLKEPSIVRILSRCLSLGSTRAKELNGWREKGRGDLGDCVERVQRQAEMPVPRSGNEVTVEQVDSALAQIAAKCRFSSPAVRSRLTETDGGASDVDGILIPLLHRMTSRDMKWFTRMLLKNYAPVVLPEASVLRRVHFPLPELLKFQDSFDAVVQLLKGPVIGRFPTQLKKLDQFRYRIGAAKLLVPKVGVKVGRVPYLKARSIKHCVQMAGRKRMSLERKYDGEYCQIHIDLGKGKDWIQIFSKSGKDSTLDREGIHETIKNSLRIGRSNCAFSSKCILEAELVVWDDQEGKVAEFHKLRKHVSRSGSFLGTALDSQPHDSEHLMLIFYDVLLIDKDPVLIKPQRKRRQQLEQLVLPIPGRADLVTREEVYFSSPDGPQQLQQACASGITQRWEGFVLKPCEEPYFTMMEHTSDNYAGCWIKLKKDYIRGLGDTADFAVVGASYDANTAKATGIKNLSWTHFHIACVENKEDVLRFDAKPVFKIVDAVNQCIRKDDLKTVNQLGHFRGKPYNPKASYNALDVSLSPNLVRRMEVMFDRPFVFEVMGSGFDKLPNTDYFTLRFPRVVKIHWDRTFKDTVGLSEYEDMADQARHIADDATSQEDAAWIAKLEQADGPRSTNPSGLADSQTLSPGQSSSEVSKCTKSAAPASLVRVDTQEMLPGAPRSQICKVFQRPTSQTSQAPVLPVPTPPASSSEIATGTGSKASNVPDAGPPAGNSKKRTADTREGDQHGSNPKRIRSTAPDDAGPSAGNSRKRTADTRDGDQHGNNPKRIRSTVPESYKAPSDSLSPTKYTVNKTPLSEVVNPSLRRRASPPLRRTRKCMDLRNIAKPQSLAAKQIPPTMDMPQTPDPTPTEYSFPAADEAPAQPASSSPKPHISTSTASPATRPTTSTTNTAPTPLDCSLTNAIVLLSPSINQMPYLTENLLSPYHPNVFIDPLRFIAYDSSQPSAPASQPESESTSSAPITARPLLRTRKLVLVESHRPEESAWLVREFARLCTYQDIEFFDWRVLEDVVELREGGEKWRRAWSRRFEGRVAWEEGVGGEVGKTRVEWIYDNY